MTAHRLIVSAPASGQLAELTKLHPEICLEATPIGNLLLLSCHGNSEALDDLEAALSARSTTLQVVRGEHALAFVVETPGPEAGLFETLERHGLLPIPPMIWQRGRIRLRLLQLGKVEADALESALPGVQLVSKTALRSNEAEQEIMATGLMLPALTRRQGQSVLAALESGYYDAPRKATAGEVARSLGIARSTFEEHLKSAESQIVRAVAPVVRMRLQGKEHGPGTAGTEALELYARFSKDLGLYVNLAVRGDRLASVSLSDEPPRGSIGTDHPYLARILDHIATGQDDLRDIPLDLEVTPFELEVLEALRAIPPGEVVTYGDIAQRLGRPRASRAIGNACAKNPIPVVVPCHRVIPAGGGLGRYSAAGGAATKRKLLEREGALQGIEAESFRGKRGRPFPEGGERQDEE